MRVLAFCFDEEHEKSARGLLSLKLANFDNVTVVAAPYQKPKSILRLAPQGLKSFHAREIARICGYSFVISAHTSLQTRGLCSQADLALVFGSNEKLEELPARLPIIATHKGLLPQTACDEPIIEAIRNNYPQGVTSYVLGKEKFKGILLKKNAIPVFGDDTLTDIYLRTQSAELSTMLESIKIFIRSTNLSALEAPHKINAPSPSELKLVQKTFDVYKQNYKTLLKDFGFSASHVFEGFK